MVDHSDKKKSGSKYTILGTILYVGLLKLGKKWLKVYGSRDLKPSKNKFVRKLNMLNSVNCKYLLTQIHRFPNMNAMMKMEVPQDVFNITQPLVAQLPLLTIPLEPPVLPHLEQDKV